MDEQPQGQAGDLKGLAQGQASDLKGLAQSKFGKLSAAERLLLEKVPTGEPAWCPHPEYNGLQYDPKNADDWEPRHQIRAELLVWLCTDEQARRHLHWRGVQVFGADITGPLDFSFANIPLQLAFRECRLREDIDLMRAEVSQLNLAGSTVKAIRADGITVKNMVFLRNGFTADGEVRLPGAQVGGDLDCSAGTFTSEGYTALNADGINVKSNVYLGDRFAAKGEVRLGRAQIGGRLDCTGGMFSNPTGRALNANRTVVQSSLFLRDGFAAEGEVRLVGARIGGAFNCQNGDFQSATLALTDASAGTLVDSGLNDPADPNPTIWPQQGKLLLDGFAYGRISSEGRINVDKRIRWLELQPKLPFRRQPYLHLAKILRDSGDKKGALRVLEKMEDLRRDEESRSLFARAWGLILKLTIGYGYHPERAIWALAFLILLGWFVYAKSYPAGRIVPTEKEAYAEFKKPEGKLPAQYPAFSPAIYSLENSVPLVKLDQAARWQPDPAAAWPPFVRWFLRLQILLGWVLATFFVAGVTGIVHKE